MPLYAYQCRECGHNLEARQSFADAPLRECPHCGDVEGLFRVVQPAGIVFKGSGFYVTDSGKRNSANPGTNGKNGSNGHKTESTAADSTPSEAPKTETPSAAKTAESAA
ncbi:MAG: hypothetical protein KJ064_00815 [Anaerolineae bacterium]|nr:hypothetical protein [Anaerolineae bacterium]